MPLPGEMIACCDEPEAKMVCSALPETGNNHPTLFVDLPEKKI
jgi:hypothetical protein